MNALVQDSVYTGFGYAKALIFGEYAVMYGAPGLVAALTPKIKITLKHPRISNQTALNHTNPIHALPFDLQLKNILNLKWAENDPQIDADISVDLNDFFDESGNKLGIGSSAAAIVALLQAKLQLRKALELPDLPLRNFLDHAITAHRMLQNQMGSGIDVIASCTGGISLVSQCPDNPVIQSISQDDIPPFVVLATHQQAPTISYISAAKNIEHTARYKLIIENLTNIYKDMKTQVLQKNHAGFLDGLDIITRQLECLAQIIDRPIIPESLYKLAPLAKSCHVCLKTSGAGGGDIFIAFAKTFNHILEFTNAIPQSSGITVLPFQIAPPRYE